MKQGKTFYFTKGILISPERLHWQKANRHRKSENVGLVYKYMQRNTFFVQICLTTLICSQLLKQPDKSNRACPSVGRLTARILWINQSLYNKAWSATDLWANNANPFVFVCSVQDLAERPSRFCILGSNFADYWGHRTLVTVWLMKNVIHHSFR